jgi:hypothetical protein
VPPSAKPGQGNVIAIPIPVRDKFIFGAEERWIIGRYGTPYNLVLNVIYNDKVVASFPLNSPVAGTNNLSGTIRLSGKNYKIISIKLNNDLVTGSIKLEKTD